MNRPRPSLNDIKKLKEDGKIIDYSDPSEPKEGSQDKTKPARKRFVKRSKEKGWMGWNLMYWCQIRSVNLEQEFRFGANRRFRSDWFIPAYKVLIEYEGLFSDKSRHTTASGYSKDTEKYNLASSLGYTVLRYTALNYKTVLQDLNKIAV